LPSGDSVRTVADEFKAGFDRVIDRSPLYIVLGMLMLTMS
jgi:hypothetical protein